MKICLAVIVKDDTEVEQFERMLASFMPYMSGLAVAITGLSAPEGTKKIARLVKKYGGEYVVTTPETHPDIYLQDEKGYYFANFAAARMVSFSIAKKLHETEKFDWFTWADSDDVLQAGDQLHNIAQQASTVKADWVHFTYWYSVRVDQEGNISGIAVEHIRERLLSPKIEWKWVSRLHEICLPADSNYEPQGMHVLYNPVKGGTKTLWVHLPDEEHFVPNLARNIKILEVQIKEEQHKDPRTLFYLAKCYIDLSEQNQDPSLLQLANMLLLEYLEMSGWAEERSFACQYLGLIAQKQLNPNEAIAWYHRAIQEHPISHLPYLWLAHLYMQQNQDEIADHWLETALKMPPPQSRTTIGSPHEIQLLATKLKYNQSMKKMDLPTAITYKQRWNELEGLPDTEDPVLKEIQGIKESNDAAVWFQNYYVYLKNHGYKDQLKQLISALSPEWQGEGFAQKLIHEALEPKVWPKKSIVYLAATPFAPYDPRTALAEGIGGSETAVIRLSEEWVTKGYQVTVYGNVVADCEHNGVTYKHWNQFNIRDTFDILILWRNVHLLDQPIQARKVFLDLHDMISQVEVTPERVAKVDTIMVKSNYHRKQLPNVSNDKVEVLSNGIDL